MKYNRQEMIISLIDEYEIETQEELSERLREKGYMVTQATISRDIREMKLQKIAAAGGKYKYALPRQEEAVLSQRFRNLLVDSVESVEAAANIVVVKTSAGMASGAAAAIDSMERSDVLGSVAGDDTIIIVMKTNDAAALLVSDLREITGI
ncbi:MAG: arginine repressor [Ruminococcaceae bacterium]|nr:arginine repressor [Oscillospiraceae bacterium]